MDHGILTAFQRIWVEFWPDIMYMFCDYGCTNVIALPMVSLSRCLFQTNRISQINAILQDILLLSWNTHPQKSQSSILWSSGQFLQDSTTACSCTSAEDQIVIASLLHKEWPLKKIYIRCRHVRTVRLSMLPSSFWKDLKDYWSVQSLLQSCMSTTCACCRLTLKTSALWLESSRPTCTILQFLRILRHILELSLGHRDFLIEYQVHNLTIRIILAARMQKQECFVILTNTCALKQLGKI